MSGGGPKRFLHPMGTRPQALGPAHTHTQGSPFTQLYLTQVSGVWTITDDPAEWSGTFVNDGSGTLVIEDVTTMDGIRLQSSDALASIDLVSYP